MRLFVFLERFEILTRLTAGRDDSDADADADVDVDVTQKLRLYTVEQTNFSEEKFYTLKVDRYCETTDIVKQK